MVSVLGSLLYFSNHRSKKIVQIADIVIDEESLGTQEKINKISGLSTQREGLLRGLIDTAYNKILLKKYGFDLSKKSIELEKNRIEKNTQLPKILDQLKQSLSKREFDEFFILANLVNQAVYFDLYLKNEQTHLESRRRALEVLKKISNNDLLSFAHQHKYPISEMQITKDHRLIWYPLPKTKDRSSPPSTFLNQEEWDRWENILKKIPPNQIAKALISHRSFWLIIKKKQTLGKTTFEVLFLNKMPYDQWLKSQRMRIPIKYF
ncbi:MAG: hypothetical protein KDD50_10430 [Bdellovibrionales bacterium]|nr:hypothetical protein [Bdellovibrionales bacterium]